MHSTSAWHRWASNAHSELLHQEQALNVALAACVRISVSLVPDAYLMTYCKFLSYRWVGKLHLLKL